MTNEFDFDFINEKKRELLEDENIDDLDSLIDLVVDQVIEPIVESVGEPVIAQVHDVVPLSKLDIQSFTDTIDLIINQMLKGLYLEYRFFSDLNKAQRKLIYEKCDSQNIGYVKNTIGYFLLVF